MFENAAVIEALKHRFNHNRRPGLSFFRDARGLECDLVCGFGGDLGIIGIKSGSTVAADCFRAVDRVSAILPQVTRRAVVCGGGQYQLRRDIEVVPLLDTGLALERFERKEPPAADVPQAVRRMAHFWHSEGEDRDEPCFPEIAFRRPDRETAMKQAARALIESAEKRGDNRGWAAAGHPDPSAVASGRHPGGQWILRYGDLKRETRGGGGQ